jgi:hypothetical protein
MIGVYIRPAGMTIEQYKAIDHEVRAAVGGEPKGMKLHTCFGEGEGIAIFDVWESEDDFKGSRLCWAQSLPPQGSSPSSP